MTILSEMLDPHALQQHTVGLVVKAWDDKSANLTQLSEEVLQCLYVTAIQSYILAAHKLYLQLPSRLPQQRLKDPERDDEMPA